MDYEQVPPGSSDGSKYLDLPVLFEDRREIPVERQRRGDVACTWIRRPRKGAVRWHRGDALPRYSILQMATTLDFDGMKEVREIDYPYDLYPHTAIEMFLAWCFFCPLYLSADVS